MESFSVSKSYFEKLSENNNSPDNKNKILYKFKIMSKNPKYHNQIGKCYLININFTTKGNLSQTKIRKKHEKLPLIKIRDNPSNLNTFTATKTREPINKEKFKLTINNEYKTIPLTFEPNNSQKRYNYKNQRNKNSSTSLTESSAYSKKVNEKKTKYMDIMNKINERYFVKNSTMKFLTSLFFGSNDMHDLKYVNLSRIKDKKPQDININNKRYSSFNNTSKYNYKLNKRFQHKKRDSLNEKINENDFLKINRSNIKEKIKKFKNLKLKKCKELVDGALKDLIKTKEKNLIYIENFRKSCDFKFEDF